MASVPVALLLVGGYFWLTGVAMPRPTMPMSSRTGYLTAEVSWRIVEAPVKENQVVAPAMFS